MQDELSGFRERLINAQDTTPALRDEYRKELDTLMNHRLTPRTRLMVCVGIAAALVGGALCARAAVRFPREWFLNSTFAVVCVLVAAWFGRVLWQGGFARRASFAMVEWLGGTATAAFVLVTLFRGMTAPSEPSSIFSALMAVLLVMTGFAWGTGNRIADAKMETREHLLRVESRLADLAERMSAAGSSTTTDRKS